MTPQASLPATLAPTLRPYQLCRQLAWTAVKPPLPDAALVVDRRVLVPRYLDHLGILVQHGTQTGLVKRIVRRVVGRLMLQHEDGLVGKAAAGIGDHPLADLDRGVVFHRLRKDQERVAGYDLGIAIAVRDAKARLHVLPALAAVGNAAGPGAALARRLKRIVVTEGVKQLGTGCGRREDRVQRLAVIGVRLLVMPVREVADMSHHVDAELPKRLHRQTRARDGRSGGGDVGVAHEADLEDGLFAGRGQARRRQEESPRRRTGHELTARDVARIRAAHDVLPMLTFPR